MTEEQIVAFVRDHCRGKGGGRFTDKAARRAAKVYLETMLFAGLLVRRGHGTYAIYLSPSDARVLDRIVR